MFNNQLYYISIGKCINSNYASLYLLNNSVSMRRFVEHCSIPIDFVFNFLLYIICLILSSTF